MLTLLLSWNSIVVFVILNVSVSVIINVITLFMFAFTQSSVVIHQTLIHTTVIITLRTTTNSQARLTANNPKPVNTAD